VRGGGNSGGGGCLCEWGARGALACDRQVGEEVVVQVKAAQQQRVLGCGDGSQSDAAAG
jgi:hypothetical protein